ncbi:MAG: hypothetical protein E7617_01270 [Ruminococcaceae bacterium]|nr:hypothetical protein [Oscillospiraceae bacterium]
MFVVYAHRGASEYYPENTLSSFRAGIEMGADGIETDVQKTKDGILVLFHDDTTDAKLGIPGRIADYTLEELLKLKVKNPAYGREDVIMTFEDFLAEFSALDLTFAIELKVTGISAEVIEMLKRYNAIDKTIITSFSYDALVETYEYDKTVRLGYLYVSHSDSVLRRLAAINAYQACPKAIEVKREHLDELYSLGYECRGWGIDSVETMKYAVEIGINGGMTVNFPDKLVEYMRLHG